MTSLCLLTSVSRLEKHKLLSSAQRRHSPDVGRGLGGMHTLKPGPLFKPKLTTLCCQVSFMCQAMF